MSIRHACFISYRHRPTQDYKDTVDDLYRVLHNEVVYYLSNESPYLDTYRLQGGNFFNHALATALCESVCMVVLYIPPYFDERYSYCAREFKAMERLERERLNLLGLQFDKSNGLIIPIICRGWDAFPQEIKNARHCYNFEPYLMEKSRISRHPKGVMELKQIAKYIYDRYKELKALNPDPCLGCQDFSFPEEAEVLNRLQQVQAFKIPFPRP
jgi:hypothetical protein